MSDDKRAGSGATHFGFETVDEQHKAQRVAGVFDSVATRYDMMNDLMSAGLHRLWKAFTVRQADVRPGMRMLDIAGGTGDLARAFADRAGDAGLVVLSDINEAMLRAGRDKLLDKGRMLPLVQCDAEHLPFADDSFDVVSVAFGLRNMTHKEAALAEMRRVIRPGGKVLVLEFPGCGRRWRRYTMPTRFPCCRGLARKWRAIATAIATWPSRSACIRRRKNSPA